MNEPFRIGVLGVCGRMGRQIAFEITQDPKTTLSGGLEYKNSPDIGKDLGLLISSAPTKVFVEDDLDSVIQASDVLIDFSTLESLEKHLEAVAFHKKKIVIGTTGLEAHHHDALQKASKEIACLWAPNMSVGVNSLLKIVGKMAQSLGEDYDIELVEKHHNKKKDAPSGTAVALVKAITDATNRSYEKDVTHGRHGALAERKPSEIGVHAVRGGGIVGEHTVIYAGEAESIEITHKAQDRRVFALGAVRAAKFLIDKEPGLYSFLDII
ncbi:4-hydroxy-tetrahydrodipicolinate reductase [PVC group bacterium (ex Bugula neritina AB1)]|nr:4-hydroxy-tetrahydrodipicolinate reductase [PVC group bacterium (ex Bugula neritina AB1)]